MMQPCTTWQDRKDKSFYKQKINNHSRGMRIVINGTIKIATHVVASRSIYLQILQREQTTVPVYGSHLAGTAKAVI